MLQRLPDEVHENILMHIHGSIGDRTRARARVCACVRRCACVHKVLQYQNLQALFFQILRCCRLCSLSRGYCLRVNYQGRVMLVIVHGGIRDAHLSSCRLRHIGSSRAVCAPTCPRRAPVQVVLQSTPFTLKDARRCCDNLGV